MVEGYYQQVVRIIKGLGYSYAENAKGSHEKWNNGETTLIVPRNLYSRHTANGILKDAGSDRRF